jgi:uncharacterized protein (TIGR03382 family)
MKLHLLAGVAGLALVAFAPGADAFVSWVANGSTGTVGPTGNNSVLGWDGGGSDNGLFGSPRVVSDTFLFIANQNFEAESFGDGSTPSNVTVTDTMRVHVHALNGNGFTEVLFHSSGDYTLFGAGSTVDINGHMTVNDLNSAGTFTDPFHTLSDHNGAFPQAGNDAAAVLDTWQGHSLITFATPLTDIELIFQNSLVAITIPGSHAVIATLPDTQGSFSLTLVPTPGTMVAGLLGLGLMSRRRR